MKKIKENKIVILTLLAVISFCVVTYMIYSSKQVLFHEKVKAEYMNDDYVQEFTLKEDSNVEFNFESDTKSGEVRVKIYDEKENTIYENSDNKINDRFSKKLKKGKYYYERKVSDSKCSFNFWADVK